MNKKDIIILIILGALLIAPLLTTGGTHDRNVYDFQNDVLRAEQVKIDGNVYDFSNHYSARTITAYLIGGTSLLTGIGSENLQLGFNYFFLVVASACVYLVTRKLFNTTAGVVASLATFFVSHSILSMFSSGDIWNIIMTVVLLPLMLYFLAMWLAHRKISHLVAALILLAMFSFLHPLGLIIPYTLGVFFGCLVIYKLTRKQYREAGKIAVLIIGIVIGNLTLSYLGIRGALDLHYTAIFGNVPVHAIENPIIFYGEQTTINFITFLYQYITFPILGLLFIATAVFSTKWKEIKTAVNIKLEAKWFLLLLASFIIPLTVASFSETSLNTIRHAMDAATMVAIAIACLIGIITMKYKNIWFYTPISIMLAIGIIPTFMVWFGNRASESVW